MNRRKIIQHILNTQQNKHKSYLEIGTGKGKNFVSINAHYKVGVDPIPPSKRVARSLNDTCKYYSMTSDEFFLNAGESEKGVKYDVIFADGLHEYSQIYRDITHSLDHLAPNGVIVAHDCKPTNEVMALPPDLYSLVDLEVKKSNHFDWTGDVWKAVVRLRSFHHDLLVFTLDCDFGCAVITRGEPESSLNFSLPEIEAMDFHDLKNDYDGLLNLKHPSYLYNFLLRSGHQKNFGRRPLLALLSWLFTPHSEKIRPRIKQ